MESLSETINLDAYFQRIGYGGSASPTLETLQAIHLHHATTIAFENLTPLLKQPVLLDLKSLEKKLIHDRRGGYCFEQNLLLRSVLIALGFQVKNLAARVLWNLPEGTIMPRSHMLLHVEIDGKPYLADVGFGGITQTAPLSLTPDIEQKTPHEPFRVIATEQTYILQAKLNGEWKPLYRFDLQEQYLSDYEVSNWYVSTHPNSRFVTGLMAARPDTDCRYSLLNNQLTTHYLNGQTERRILKDVTEFHHVLEDLFRLQLPMTSDLDRVLQQLMTSG
ncbi:arylamine N-acetyltransferase [Leptolyngbya boryana NIES-2135]|uniref:Arylamine N-acetyltransferase n=1 Tax=Leptolyngbya boryana NIES-2135 TaxID=1973484 RepID=A0A1Z4JJE6_LEPBY|nr:arylamine N-acetyltransferase [Leptolyngbya boryana]MBD2368956.1 arylamine N-acetyltransferase [Leptolyngbya sp. FACHB-161]MBD2375836.1 arylamine N-acetyltransferase [Leptolyngbya sp. FACHB-238]MBD2399950.1 arylamine N-acetyltransferase [Leptolyngbya sp. FACHB-239]MBD2406156.1 arylamine N-acetyltransferase [Leptolyngbya sp. FACHB-402]BAY56879.1 arylamine N-acetyltransferase [Leptolyngbya boryana NIES-2135]